MTREPRSPRTAALKHADTVTVVLGVLITLAGVFALVYSYVASAAVIVAAGLALLAGGMFNIIDALAHRRERQAGRGIVTGVLHAVVGVMMLWRPDLTLLSVTLLLGVLFFAGGINRAVLAFSTKHAAWGWELAGGLVSVLLGVLIVLNWPLTSFWLVGTLVGIELLTTGLALMASGAFFQRFERREEEALPAT